MDTTFRLPLAQAAAVWKAAAATAGAELPRYIREELAALVAERDRQRAAEEWILPLPPDQQAVLAGIGTALTQCRTEHIDAGWSAGGDNRYFYTPMPRGLDIGLEPCGSVGIVWRTERHVVSLALGAHDIPTAPDEEGRLRDEAVVEVECLHDPTDATCERVAIAQAAVDQLTLPVGIGKPERKER